jgi:cell wall-associated NlpC family hydrolase
LHLPFIRLPDVGGSIPFRASVDQGAVAPPPTQMGQAITAAAKHFLGIQYKWGGTSPTTGFDCSGLTQYVFAKFGVHIPRVAADQFNAGHKVSRGQAQAGDLVFFSSAAQGVHHVGIYLGNGMFLQAPHTGDVVKISKLSDRGDIAGFRRFGR